MEYRASVVPEVSIPEFSIIVPTFGRPAFLAEAVASVLAQTLADFECIVVDDATPGGLTASVSDPRVRTIRRDSNGGPAAARNTGIEEARGRYLAFLDDDDVWQPGRLEAARRAHERAPLVCCWQGTLGEPDEKIASIVVSTPATHRPKTSIGGSGPRPTSGSRPCERWGCSTARTTVLARVRVRPSGSWQCAASWTIARPGSRPIRARNPSDSGVWASPRSRPATGGSRVSASDARCACDLTSATPGI
jgi:glycosyltransferase involved in cell wall biosynthesis